MELVTAELEIAELEIAELDEWLSAAVKREAVENEATETAEAIGRLDSDAEDKVAISIAMTQKPHCYDWQTQILGWRLTRKPTQKSKQTLSLPGCCSTTVCSTMG